MSIATDNDLDIQTDVQDELAWNPEIDSAAIGVAVEAGTVQLSGEVRSLSEKVAAEKAALRVRGVRTIINALTVHPKDDWPVTTTDIAKEVDRALEWASNVPESVKAKVVAHDVTLTGEVDWDYQRKAALRAVQHLRGIYRINDTMTLRARPVAADTERRIKQAIERSAELDANTIHVGVSGNAVTLTGTVRSWAEKRQASSTAWSSPHVTEVHNDIVIAP